ncbi:MAG: serine/threonine protein kinase, partial [Planctomycetaceae bacterium]|nr:serine/threonine protein kinase [Planctomycetaceae bacterium]
MSSCPQCHADFSAEDLDLKNPTCPVCGEPLGGQEALGDPDNEEVNETEEHNPLANAPKIDGFEMTRHVGRGGMGDVWEAKQNVLGRKVAIKVLAKNLSHSEHFLARFTREAHTLGRLQHPGIVSIHDFRSSPDGLCCIIMEYVEGPTRGEPTTLFDLILRKELTPERIRFLILQVLHALQYAHEEGVIHRDI